MQTAKQLSSSDVNAFSEELADMILKSYKPHAINIPTVHLLTTTPVATTKSSADIFWEQFADNLLLTRTAKQKEKTVAVAVVKDSWLHLEKIADMKLSDNIPYGIKECLLNLIKKRDTGAIKTWLDNLYLALKDQIEFAHMELLDYLLAVHKALEIVSKSTCTQYDSIDIIREKIKIASLLKTYKLSSLYREIKNRISLNYALTRIETEQGKVFG